ncbi:MAG: hypothetical protein J1E42_06100 [Akkermansiaceae bacterium]|nr:hypothetical protein [Akkermansiaceae bacterium]
MKSCLGTLLLTGAVLALILTVGYHASVNSELRFDQRDSHMEYINTQRSYRPSKAAPASHQTPPQAVPMRFNDDELAEEEDS